MSLLSPLSFKIPNLRPFSNAPATSLVDYLPVGGKATCLLLECDPRKILYTMYAEENNGNFLGCIANLKDSRESTI
jgi:hypothetical protein